MPVKAAKEGASHLRQRANHRVRAASARAKNGMQTRECVTLRCHVKISIGSLENQSRIMSESGKIAPSISDQVMILARFMGFDANMSSPRKTALPINAPAMPCVMVSIRFFYTAPFRWAAAPLFLIRREKLTISENPDQWSCFRD